MTNSNICSLLSIGEPSAIDKRHLFPASLSDGKLLLPAIDLILPLNDVLDQSYIKDGDIIFVSGTLVEGQGNSCSDLDIYVLTDRLREVRDITVKNHHRVLTDARDIVLNGCEDSKPVRLIHTTIPGCAVKIDIEYKTFGEVELLFDEVKDIYDYAVENLILLTKRISEREESFLHRLQNSICIWGEAAYSGLISSAPSKQYQYVAYRWAASDFSILLDIAGAVSFHDWLRAVDLSRENLITQTSGFLRAKGIVNLRRKWVVHYAQGHLPPSLWEEFQSLYLLQGVNNSLSSYQIYVRRALNFVDCIFEFSLQYIEENQYFPSGVSAISSLEAKQQTEGGDLYSRLELEYRKKAYGVALRATTEFEIFNWSDHN